MAQYGIAVLTLLASWSLRPAAAAVAPAEYPDLVNVEYTDPHDGANLVGRLAMPASSSQPLPAAVILPDWTGNDGYEAERAKMIASDWGYVAFAADVYGDGISAESMTDRVGNVTRFNDDEALANARVDAAIDYVKGLQEVDQDRVAILGYW